MTDYQIFINALRKCVKEHENDVTPTGHIVVSTLCQDTANLLETLEQEPKIGYWILNDDKEHGRCSECGCKEDLVNGHSSYKWCSNCGARMEGHKTEALNMIENIKAEIEHEGEMYPDGDWYISIDRVCEIFDKHTEEQKQWRIG